MMLNMTHRLQQAHYTMKQPRMSFLMVVWYLLQDDAQPFMSRSSAG
jgi:hypothetical protein